jgi:hypothetical protein
VSNVSLTKDATGAALPTGISGPVKLGTDTRWAIIDPGPYADAYPSTYKGVGAGSLWFPRGQDMLDEGMLRARALSGTTTRGNNLRGLNVAVTAAASTSTLSFATRTYSNPTSFSLAQSTGGSLALGAYFVRVAGRPVLGGPVLALSQQTITLTGSNNAIQINCSGLKKAPFYLEGFTIYRGTTTNVYTTRYDVVPNMDWHGMGGGGFDEKPVKDLGTTLSMATTATSLAWGYPDPASVTATGGHPSWTGSQWTVQDETGWEADVNYEIWIAPSWQTTWRVTAKRLNGFDVEFAVPAPTGGGTYSWLMVR